MGTKRAGQEQEALFYAGEQAEAPGHPFYQRLNAVLNEAGLDAFCEKQCRPFYHTQTRDGRRLLRAYTSGCY